MIFPMLKRGSTDLAEISVAFLIVGVITAAIFLALPTTISASYEEHVFAKEVEIAQKTAGLIEGDVSIEIPAGKSDYCIQEQEIRFFKQTSNLLKQKNTITIKKEGGNIEFEGIKCKTG